MYERHYAVLINPKVPPGAALHASGQLLIFCADTLEYLGVINV